MLDASTRFPPSVSNDLICRRLSSFDNNDEDYQNSIDGGKFAHSKRWGGLYLYIGEESKNATSYKR